MEDNDKVDPAEAVTMQIEGESSIKQSTQNKSHRSGCGRKLTNGGTADNQSRSTPKR